MTAADWYARHLGNGRPQVQAYQPPPPQQQQYYAPQPQAYAGPQGYQPPPGYALVPVQQEQAPQVPVFEMPGQYNPWAVAPPVDTSKIPRGAVNPENFLYMSQFWRGGQGNKAAEHCPRCDGVLFRRFEGRREAAPMCTSCGWNGLFDQGENSYQGAA